VADLIGQHRTTGAPAVGPTVHIGLEEEAVDDELAPAIEQIEQTGRSARPVEAVYVCAAVAACVEMFATRVRYSGFCIGYNICVAAFGGTTPYVVTWLTAQTANTVAPAYYVVAAALVSLLAILSVRETAGRPLPRGVADEMFQSEADVRGAAATG
jgi:hypothetical protein